jgi:hypothetical protein
MRADAHYVDQLSAPRAARRTEAQKAESRMPDSERLHQQLAEDLATIQGAAALLAGDPPGLARQVSLDLIRHQAWRAAWLLGAIGILEGGLQPRFKARRLGLLLSQVRDGLGAECRLSRVGLETWASDWDAAVDVDERLVISGVTSAVLATLAQIDQSDWSVVRVAAHADGGLLTRIEITQEEVSVDEDTRRRFFDQSWTTRPGGWTAAVAAATARAVALLHGGEAALESSGRRGSRLTLTFGRT